MKDDDSVSSFKSIVVTTQTKLPDLDPGRNIQSFDVSFKVRMTKNGAEPPAEGFSINIGPIPSGEGGGPLGFAIGIAAALSMGDLGVIALFAGDNATTLPLVVQRLMGAYRMDQAAAAALLLVMLSFAIFWFFDAWGRRTDCASLNRVAKLATTIECGFFCVRPRIGHSG